LFRCLGHLQLGFGAGHQITDGFDLFGRNDLAGERQGFFNPDVIDRLRAEYTQSGFKLNLPFEDDLLIVVLTFSIFLDTFNLPNFN